MFNLSRDAQHTDSLRAVAGAVAASGAEDLAELLRIDGELVQDALPLAAGLRPARIVAGGVRREHRELAGVPGSHAGVARGWPGVHNVEAVAGWTRKRAGATAQASERMLGPERVFEMLRDKRANRLWIELLLWTLVGPGGLIRFFRFAAEQSAAFLRQAADLIVAVSEVEQHDIGAALRRRIESCLLYTSRCV